MIETQKHGGAVTPSVRDQDPLEALTVGLAASEERYRTLFETMPMGIVHYDADGSIIGANPAAREILGLDLIRATTWPVVPPGQTVREDGSPFPRDELPVPEALRTGRVVADRVAGVRHAKTGELRWVRITAVPDARDERGRPSQAYAIFTDLTDDAYLDIIGAYAVDDPDPARVLERTNLAVTSLLPDVLASAAYAVLDPATGALRYANAGHPPPLIAGDTGDAEYLDDTVGAMLGASAGTSFTAGRRQLRPGTRLLLYTDGLIEDRHRDITDGLTALAETLRRSGPGSAAETCARVHAALLSTAARHDDVCLLMVRLAPDPDPPDLILVP